MEKDQRKIFDLLLKKVGEKLKENHPEINLPITDWKGEEITLLRVDLLEKTQGNISEKWFYTHIKNQHEKLPRVDTLNLLANYIDKRSWNEFYYQNNFSLKTSIVSKSDNLEIQPKKQIKKNKNINIPILIGVLIFSIIVIVFTLKQKKANYLFCFLDQNTHLPVVDSFLEVKIIKENQTPLFFPLKSNCLEGKGSKIEFVVKGRFYKPIHIKRVIQNDTYQESIFIEPDDYAMMIHLFANSKVKDWKKRRTQLAEMMHENLRAYEITNDGFTIDILNKKEFINKMTLPTRELQKVSIITTAYEKDKVSLIKFTQE